MYDCMLVHPFFTRTLMTLKVNRMYKCMIKLNYEPYFVIVTDLKYRYWADTIKGYGFYFFLKL